MESAHQPPAWEALSGRRPHIYVLAVQLLPVVITLESALGAGDHKVLVIYLLLTITYCGL